MNSKSMRTHCNERNYSKIEKFITSEVNGTISFEYQITTQIETATQSTKEPLVVFTFTYGDSPENLSKITRFMKIIGENHV